MARGNERKSTHFAKKAAPEQRAFTHRGVDKALTFFRACSGVS